MKDFAVNYLGLKVLTPDGYRGFGGIAYMGDSPIVEVSFSNGRMLRCTSGHKLFCPHGLIPITGLNVGDYVYRGDGRRTKVKNIVDTGLVEPVYDLIEVEGSHKYATNGVMSSNCEFVTDDETLLHPMMLSRMKSYPPEYYTGTVRWFSDILPNRTYMVALDPSLGTGHGDYSAIQIFMLPEMLQVGEWQHNATNPRGQVRRLMQILLFLDATLRDDPDQQGEPEIYWTVENNTIGETILMTIEDTGEERFPGMFVSEKKKKGQTRRFRKGMNTDNRKKLASCARFKNLMETDRMHIRSEQLIRELKNFVHKEAGFSAKPGEHDDLTMATLLIVRMLDIVISWGGDMGDLKEYIGDDELFDGDEGMPVVV